MDNLSRNGPAPVESGKNRVKMQPRFSGCVVVPVQIGLPCHEGMLSMPALHQCPGRRRKADSRRTNSPDLHIPGNAHIISGVCWPDRVPGAAENETRLCGLVVASVARTVIPALGGVDSVFRIGIGRRPRRMRRPKRGITVRGSEGRRRAAGRSRPAATRTRGFPRHSTA